MFSFLLLKSNHFYFIHIVSFELEPTSYMYCGVRPPEVSLYNGEAEKVHKSLLVIRGLCLYNLEAEKCTKR
jgi:hypothetical protein